MDEKPFSLEKLTEFVGREVIVQEISSLLQAGEFHLVFVTGSYGIGKTELFKYFRELAESELKYPGTPTDIIDLYHTLHHSPEGLARSIIACYEKSGNSSYFESCYSAREALDTARASGDSRAIHTQTKDLLDSCIAGLKRVSAEHGLLLLFDTCEKLVYPSKQEVRLAPAWNWLKDWIDDIPRGVILFAGRANVAGHRLADVLVKEITDPKPVSLSLDFFSLAETKKYLEANAKRRFQATGSLVGFTAEDIQKLHTVSQGRPILLAMYLELRVRNILASKDLDTLRPETFEQRIIDHLLSLPDLGETIKAAGRVPKGINAAILAKIRGISEANAEQSLTNAKKLAFFKTFSYENDPQKERVFLHEEMYSLLGKHVYSDVSDTGEGQEAAKVVYEYYKEQTRQTDEELSAIYAHLAQESDSRVSPDIPPDLVRIRTLEEMRQALKAEFIYYRLRHKIGKKGVRSADEDDPIQAGLRNSYRFGHEAATSNNDEILIRLQIELTAFWLDLDKTNFWKPFIEGLLLVIPMWQGVATGQPYLDQITTAVEHLATIPDLRDDQRIILHALLETWRGTSIVFSNQANYEQAENIFAQNVVSLKALDADPRLKWFRDAVLSLCYRQRAYTRRIVGDLPDAIADYVEGLRFSREIKFYHEEATLRNDFGSVQMHLGKFQSAAENLQDGLRLRYDTAIGPRIALSYSTLSQYHTFIGAYEEGRRKAQCAVRISEIVQAVGYWRGHAFGHLRLAEATRRYAFSFQDLSNQKRYLLEAKEAVERAISSFNSLSERSRPIDARLEEACVYRALVRVETDPNKKDEWFQVAAAKFREVAEAAREAKIWYRQVDAMGNQIWLGYYARNLQFAREAAHEFESLEILEPYWWKDGQFIDKERAEKDRILWFHIGKYCMAKGMMALDIWQERKDVLMLAEAAHSMMMSMFYSKEFAPDHRGLREGRQAIYRALAQLNSEELKRFCNFVLKAEETEHIPEKPSELQNLMKDHALWLV